MGRIENVPNGINPINQDRPSSGCRIITCQMYFFALTSSEEFLYFELFILEDVVFSVRIEINKLNNNIKITNVKNIHMKLLF